MILKVVLLILVPAHALKHWALGLLQDCMTPLAGIGAEMLVSISLDDVLELAVRFTTAVWFVLYVAIKSFRSQSAEPRFGGRRR